MAVLLAIVGFAAMTQVRANQQDDTYQGLRDQDLIDVLNGLAGTSQRAQAEITRLENARAELLTSTSAREAALEQARTEADTLEILAGSVPVTGPGIRITIEEVDGPVDIDSLLDTVQELRTAGAEAMQFNGEVRVVAQTSFEDGVGGIEVDGQLLEPPYVIDVIGEPATLSGGTGVRPGPDRPARGRRCQRRRRRAPVARHRERASHDQAAVRRAGNSAVACRHIARPEETSCTPRT